jgi:NADH-quinone oxidoreductase subunit J
VAIPDTIPVLGASWSDFLFVVFAFFMIVAAVLVVALRDIIRAGLAMIVFFGALAGLYVLLGAPFIAGAQVLVYIGAISVLILFAIMLTQSKAGPSRLVFQTQALAAAIASLVLAVVLVLAVLSTDWGEVGQVIETATDALAQLLFDEYVLPFEVVSVLLLAAVVGGVYLARHQEREGS